MIFKSFSYFFKTLLCTYISIINIRKSYNDMYIFIYFLYVSFWESGFSISRCLDFNLKHTLSGDVSIYCEEWINGTWEEKDTVQIFSLMMWPNHGLRNFSSSEVNEIQIGRVSRKGPGNAEDTVTSCLLPEAVDEGNKTRKNLP